MSRLINADKLKKDILDLQDCYNGFSDTYDKACIIGVIDEQPTIEERKTVSDEEWTKARGGWTNQPERKTGKWIKIHWKAFRCSECGKISDYSTSYCPNCGARMER